MSLGQLQVCPRKYYFILLLLQGVLVQGFDVLDVVRNGVLVLRHSDEARADEVPEAMENLEQLIAWFARQSHRQRFDSLFEANINEEEL